jgi:hypothetical protein
MTRDEHYAEAERLLAITRTHGVISGWPAGFDTRRDIVALAQLHATMALYDPPIKIFRDAPRASSEGQTP